jgi:hypothetical protein
MKTTMTTLGMEVVDSVLPPKKTPPPRAAAAAKRKQQTKKTPLQPTITSLGLEVVDSVLPPTTPPRTRATEKKKQKQQQQEKSPRQPTAAGCRAMRRELRKAQQMVRLVRRLKCCFSCIRN